MVTKTESEKQWRAIAALANVDLGPGLAAFMRELRCLLRALQTTRGLRHAERIVRKHEPLRRRGPSQITGSGTFDTFLKALEEQGWLRSFKRVLVGGRRWKNERTFTSGDPLESVCELARDDVLNRGRAGPVRTCRCGRFFVWPGFFVGRGRPALFCSARCKSRSRPSRADEMYRRRAPGGRRAIQAAIEKLKRRKMPAARKRRLLAILAR